MSKVREFFKKAGSGARKFFSKADSTISSGLGKLGGVARQVGNIAQQALPIAALVAPELAPAIALAGTASNVAGAGIKRAQQVQSSVRQGVANTKRVIQAPLPVDSGSFNPAPMFA